MGTNYTLSSILHIARADFLQRVRSYYFLITIGVCVFIIYSFVPALDAGYKMVSLGNYRGFYNSAWIGGMVAMCVPFFTLLGFYVINNAVKRDIDTGVGQIIATTRVTSLQYLSGKFLSNFAVLLTMVGVIALMTVVMFFLRGEAIFEPWKLMSPLLVLTVPAMFVLAAIAVVFDSFTSLGRGVINIAYFFFWVFLISSSLWARNLDVFGKHMPVADHHCTFLSPSGLVRGFGYRHTDHRFSDKMQSLYLGRHELDCRYRTPADILDDRGLWIGRAGLPEVQPL